MNNRIKEMVYAGLLTALAIIIPSYFGFLRIFVPPAFSATIAAHVPMMMAMLISPFVAVVVGVVAAVPASVTVAVASVHTVVIALVCQVVVHVAEVLVAGGRGGYGLIGHNQQPDVIGTLVEALCLCALSVCLVNLEELLKVVCDVGSIIEYGPVDVALVLVVGTGICKTHKCRDFVSYNAAGRGKHLRPILHGGVVVREFEREDQGCLVDYGF